MPRYEIRLDAETEALLDAIARHEGLTRAAAIRVLVREGARRRKITSSPARTPPSADTAD